MEYLCCPDCGEGFWPNPDKRFTPKQRLLLHQYTAGHGRYDESNTGIPEGFHDVDRVDELVRFDVVQDDPPPGHADQPDQDQRSTPEPDAGTAAEDPDTSPTSSGPDDAATLPGGETLSLEDVPAGYRDGADQDEDLEDDGVDDTTSRSRSQDPEADAAAAGPEIPQPTLPVEKFEPVVRPIVDNVSDILDRRLEKWGVEPTTQLERDALTEAWSYPVAYYWPQYDDAIPLAYAVIATGSIWGTRVMAAYDAKQQGKKPDDGETRQAEATDDAPEDEPEGGRRGEDLTPEEEDRLQAILEAN